MFGSSRTTKTREVKESCFKNKKSTVRSSIPYCHVIADTEGMIESAPGLVTMSFYLPDTNYTSAGAREQELILDRYQEILDSWNSDYVLQLSWINRVIDMQTIKREVQMPYRNDGYDELRESYNQIRLADFTTGSTALKSEKYLTVGIKTRDVSSAIDDFSHLKKDLHFKFQAINKKGIETVSLEQRLELLHDFYNRGAEGTFARELVVDGTEIKTFDLDSICAHGGSTKDIVGPTRFVFYPSYIKCNDKYIRVMYLKSLPNKLCSDFLEKLSKVPAQMMISLSAERMSQSKANAWATAAAIAAENDVCKAQQRLARDFITPDMVSRKLTAAVAETDEILTQVREQEQGVYTYTLTVAYEADTIEDLDTFTKLLKTSARNMGATLDILHGLQEPGLNTTLPLAWNQLEMRKTATTESLAAIQPFACQIMMMTSGLRYGYNEGARSPIYYDRLDGRNQCGAILGMTGGGKSVLSKDQLTQSLLTDTKTIHIVIDPDNEYKVLARYFGDRSQVIHLSPGSPTHINPLDLDISVDEEKERDPLSEKVDFVIAMIETMRSTSGPLSDEARGILDMVLHELYEEYIVNIESRGLTIDREICPTLTDLYDRLMARRDAYGQALATSLYRFVKGSLNIFAHRTNVNMDAQLIIYDISNIGSSLMDTGMLIAMSNSWNTIIRNRALERRTCFWADEFLRILKHRSSADFMQMIWKQGRKWWCTPTCMTQNVTDLLNYEEGIDILQASQMFTVLLAQSSKDAEHLADIYELQPEQKQELLSAPNGAGLLCIQRNIIPFKNIIPKDTLLYDLFSTKPKDAEAFFDKYNGKEY